MLRDTLLACASFFVKAPIKPAPQPQPKKQFVSKNPHNPGWLAQDARNVDARTTYDAVVAEDVTFVHAHDGGVFHCQTVGRTNTPLKKYKELPQNAQRLRFSWMSFYLYEDTAKERVVTGADALYMTESGTVYAVGPRF